MDAPVRRRTALIQSQSVASVGPFLLNVPSPSVRSTFRSGTLTLTIRPCRLIIHTK